MCRFQLRAYIFLARNLLGSDPTGLSDPFARIILRDKVVQTRIVMETLNPMWNQMLIVPRVDFHITAHLFRQNPPLIVVEIFDYDEIVRPFMLLSAPSLFFINIPGVLNQLMNMRYG